jgi:peptidoglycan/xylan/chitin deacetylase (PgdA/CDA1 family)
MYFGSVRFFKHLIYLSMIIISLLAVYGAWYIGNLLLCNFYVSAQSNSDSIYKEIPKNINNSNNSVINKESRSSDSILSAQFSNALSNDLINRTADIKSEISYQSLYPEMHSEMPVQFQRKPRTVYLTFDDGPSERTLEILDILNRHNIKATFFIVSNNSDIEILKRIADEGHAIGIHSHSHNYHQIYDSVEAFLDDFNTCYNKIYETTSVKPQIFRFPGGSINAHNMGIYQDIISEMLRRGFIYYDWNISTGDTSKNATKNNIIKNVTKGFNNQESIILLCHDNHNKTNTVAALPDIIDYFQNEGYSFDKLDKTVEPLVFTYLH